MEDQIQVPEAGKPAPKPAKQDHLRVLANGAVYDMRTKRIVANPGGGKYAITPETASDFHAKAQEHKRNRLRAAANAVAMQGGGVDGRELLGDWAFVEAIGEAMTMKALTVNDPKAVDAARFLFKETGISEEQAKTQAAGDEGGLRSVIADLADIARAIHLPLHDTNIIDADE